MIRLGAILDSIIDELCTADQLRRRRRARWAAGIPDRIEREIYWRSLGVRGRRMKARDLRRIEAGIYWDRYLATTAGNYRKVSTP